MTHKLNRIVIVGGGSAGWLSAAYLAKHFQSDDAEPVHITLIESSDVGTIGVGEATFPTIRNTMNFLGIPEAYLMKHTSASFKQAIRFDDWLYAPTKEKKHTYYHSFQNPVKVRRDHIAPYWILDGSAAKGQSFVDYCSIQGQLCDAGKAPKRTNDQFAGGGFQYAYHLDAGQLADLLKSYSIEMGVEHIVGHVDNVVTNADGNIDHLVVRDQEPLAADLFIDCSGFSALLIGKVMKSNFKEVRSTLFCDRAVTVQVPYDSEDAPVKPYTHSTAQENGWTWDIGLNNRRGIGYVYSSDHTNDSRAEEVLKNYADVADSDLMLRKLDMRIGYRPKTWVNNCVAIGLSAGFVEPLESTGILQVELAVQRLTSLLTRKGSFQSMSPNYNDQTTEWYEGIVDFIKLHYCLSKRTDTDFWRDNRRPETIPDRVQNFMEQWKYRTPNEFDINLQTETFGVFSIHQIIYGMNYPTDLSGEENRHVFGDLARARSAQIQDNARKALQYLPSHRALLDETYALGHILKLGDQ